MTTVVERACWVNREENDAQPTKGVKSSKRASRPSRDGTLVWVPGAGYVISCHVHGWFLPEAWVPLEILSSPHQLRMLPLPQACFCFLRMELRPGLLSLPSPGTRPSFQWGSLCSSDSPICHCLPLRFTGHWGGVRGAQC